MAEQYQYQDEGQAALTGAFTGAMAGAAAGPIGILAGGIIGFGLGAFNSSEQNRATREAQRRRSRIIAMSQHRESQARLQAQSITAPQGDRRVSIPGQESPRGTIGQNMVEANPSSAPSSAGTF